MSGPLLAVEDLQTVFHTPDGAVKAVDAASATDVSTSQLETAVRSTYGIPNELGDDEAERIVSEAVAAVAEDDIDVAEEHLDAFGTVCERENPHPRPTPAGHPAACHLHDIPENEHGNSIAND